MSTPERGLIGEKRKKNLRKALQKLEGGEQEKSWQVLRKAPDRGSSIFLRTDVGKRQKKSMKTERQK